MDNRRQDMPRFIVTVVVLVLLVLTFGVYLFQLFRSNQTTTAFIIIGPMALILTIAIPVFIRKFREIKQGIPAQDERTKKVFVYAGYRAFLISIYWLLAIMYAVDNGTVKLDVSGALSAGILGMTIILALCYLWGNRRGEEL